MDLLRAVTTLQTQVRTLEQEVKTLREWRHDVASTLMVPVQEQIQDAEARLLAAIQRRDARDARGDGRRPYVHDAKLVITTVALTYAVLKALHLLP